MTSQNWFCSSTLKNDNEHETTPSSSPPVLEAEIVEKPSDTIIEEPLPQSTGPVAQHAFQAETRQLLDIVTNSIYTDKEVFIRELISNASDALEKVRHLQAIGENIMNPELKPEIHITTNEAANTLTITDTGVGMTKDELISNLGTIARSGSKAFLDQIKNPEADTAAAASTTANTGIIGKFGVGFYSAFMVGDRIDVYSQSALNANENHVWQSDGAGSFEIAPTTTGDQRGSKVVIHLKDSCKEYAQPKTIESIIRKYSNFVSYPIFVNDTPVNTIQALWTMEPSEVTDTQYSEFYKYIANAFDEPSYRLNFRTDAPIELKSLFFIGSTHMEKHGYGRLEPGVSLYSRKVLIEKNCKNVLPDWLRFVKGCVDSEDLPLSLSRETMQDSKIVAKIRDVLTRRILRFLNEQANKDAAKFNIFFAEFGQFLKEGLCSDFLYKEALAKLIRYESSNREAGEVTSFDDYISRCKPDDDVIYYLSAPTRELALASPYYEQFKATGREVLFVYGPIDDFVMSNIGTYNSRTVTSAECAADLNTDKDTTESDSDTSDLDLDKHDTMDLGRMSDSAAKEFAAWLKDALVSQVKEVKMTSRLTSSPAIITEHESSSVRRMMAMVNNTSKDKAPAPAKNVLEINAKHPIMRQLNQLRVSNPDLSNVVAAQLYDNAAMAAGLIDDGRVMLPRLNSLLEKLMANHMSSTSTATVVSSSTTKETTTSSEKEI